MYIMVKQLSKANPTKKRHTVKDQKSFVNAVAIPAIAPTIFAAISDGILPYRSAIKPNNRPPIIAPQKNIDWAMVGNGALSQTQFNWKIY